MFLLHRRLSHKIHPTATFKILARQFTEKEVTLLISLSRLILIELYHSLCKPCWIYPWLVPHKNSNVFPITDVGL